MIPAAPASSIAFGKVLRLYPAFLTLSRQSSRSFCRSSFIFSKDSSVANSSQLSSVRPVGCGIDMSTNLPFTLGNQFSNSIESATSGIIIQLAFSGPNVPGLQAIIVPSRVRTRGSIMSMCEIPLLQPRHLPHSSFLAEMPHPLYFSTAQSCAFFICGVPTSRGPITSKSSWASCFNCELSMASVQICFNTSSSVARFWAIAAEFEKPNKQINIIIIVNFLIG